MHLDMEHKIEIVSMCDMFDHHNDVIIRIRNHNDYFVLILSL